MNQNIHLMIYEDELIKDLKEDIEYLDDVKTEAYWEYIHAATKLSNAKSKLAKALNEKHKSLHEKYRDKFRHSSL